MTEGLHPRQAEILDYLRQRSQDGGYPPSVREIGRAVGLSSSSTVQNHLNLLERKGLIRRDPTKSRTVLLTQHGSPRGARPGFLLPLVGQVAAGAPLLAEQNVEEHLVLGPEIAGGEGSFLLRVRGESMRGDGILDGDLVVVKPDSDAPNGSVAVVRLESPETGESEVTVKHLYRERGRLRLEPSNDAFRPILTDHGHVEGRVVAVIRLLRQ
ncbi:MAG: transcriptional repressor LexA [Candidatus Dormibacteria bacterium]